MMLSTVAGLAVAFALTSAFAASAWASARASDNSYLVPIAVAVGSASKIEAWKLSCRDTLASGVINASAERVVGRAADLDRAMRARLRSLLAAAAKDTANCVEYRCTVCAGYRLVVHDREPPLEMMVTRGCTSWRITRAGGLLAGERSCSYLPPSLIDRLVELMRGIYGPQFEP